MSYEQIDPDETPADTERDSPNRISKREFIGEVAKASYLPYDIAERFYESFIATLLNHIRAGDHILLTGFGKFYWQEHGGHPVKFGDKRAVDPYPVMRFSSARDINGFLKMSDEEVELNGIPGTRTMKPRKSQAKDSEDDA